VEEERQLLEINLSKLYIMEKMKTLHKQVRKHLDDEEVKFD
jgi:hypothetical protein